jgi:tyrosinase
MPFIPTEPTGPYPVKGTVLRDGEHPGIRQELREFKKNEDLWNLYLLGLWQFQKIDQKKQLSYFQIAGIHGLPYEAWPVNDQKLKELAEKRRAQLRKGEAPGVLGFCTHTSILFLTWHRPYLALFESILRDSILYVANEFAKEGQERYGAAAKAFRLPYWDWAQPDLPVFPDEATVDKVRVAMPQSLIKEYKLDHQRGIVEIDNPLYSYHFQDETGVDFKIENRQTTMRYANSGEFHILPELSPEQKREQLMRNITPYSREVNTEVRPEVNLRERVSYLLQSYESFDQVSHNQWDPTRTPRMIDGKPSKYRGLGFGSMEDIHNTVHVLVGGWGDGYNGHMKQVPISAFDPIFWLHHTNIDRLISIWQGLHDAPPNKEKSWVTTKPSLGGTWVTSPSRDEGLDTPLAPFYKDAENFWDSSDVRNTSVFGYAYPETKSWNFKSPEDYREDIVRQINTLYQTGSISNMITASRAGDKQPEIKLRKRAERLAQVEAVPESPTTVTLLSLIQATSQTEASEVSETSLASALPPIQVPSVQIPEDRSLNSLAKNNTYLEWLVNIKAQKHMLEGEYLVHVFLGPVQEDESTILYSVSPYHVGTFSPLGQPEETKCGKCQLDQAACTEITGQIPLTIALVERYFAGVVDSLDEDDVITYLQKNLHWEVVDRHGRRLHGHRDAVSGLLVGVVSNKVTLPGNDYQLPRYSQDITIYAEITTKQDGSRGRAEGTGVTEENKYFSGSSEG